MQSAKIRLTTCADSSSITHFLGSSESCFVAVGNVGGQALSTLTLCLVDGTDFAAGILGIPLIEPVLDTCHVAVGAVGVNSVEVVVDGNIPHAVLEETCS